MHRFAFLLTALLLAGCTAVETEQAAMPWETDNPRFQECLRFASVSYCQDEIYGDGG